MLCTALALVALAGCGSSKPAYCSARTNLESSIKGLSNVNVSNGITGVKTQLQKIQTDASTLVSKAKGDFPNETSAITSSVDELVSAVDAVAGSPSTSQVAAVVSSASSVVSSVTSFVDATKSKCS